jgi:hypothetical protein
LKSRPLPTKLPGNKADFTLKFNKTDSGGVFLNSYNAKLTNEKNEEISHNFPVNRENTFTAKEAINLLEGRSVKIEFHNPKSDQQETAFVSSTLRTQNRKRKLSVPKFL